MTAIAKCRSSHGPVWKDSSADPALMDCLVVPDAEDSPAVPAWRERSSVPVERESPALLRWLLLAAVGERAPVAKARERWAERVCDREFLWIDN